MSVNFHELIEGFHNFKESYLLKEHEFFDRLAHGQSPKTLVIACCDSRAAPAILMGCRPGDLFVVRSIAALVPGADHAGDPDAVLAAVEYGVKHLDVDHIIVMGHSNCGGIHGALFPKKIADEKWISRWVSLAVPVAEEIRREEPLAETELLARRTEGRGAPLARKSPFLRVASRKGGIGNAFAPCALLRHEGEDHEHLECRKGRLRADRARLNCFPY